MKKLYILMLLVVGGAGVAAAQRSFEVEEIGRLFQPRSIGQMRPMADGERYTNITGGLVRSFNYSNGMVADTLLDGSKLGIKIRDYTLSNDEQKILVMESYKPLYRRTGFAKYGIYDRRTGRYSPISDYDSLRTAKLSPNGENVLYIRDNNIYILWATGQTEAITTDGVVNNIINGMPDWVYEEEFAVSSLVSWSPDGTQIAYLKSDERLVREYRIPFYTRSNDPYPMMYSYKYPVAGETNSTVSLHLYNCLTHKTVKVDMGSDPEKYIPYFGWTPDGQLYAFRLDRPQHHFDILLANPDGKTTTIYSESSPKYVEVDDLDEAPIWFLMDGHRFIIRNETAAGRWHLYLYDVRTGLIGAITTGDWDVNSVVRVTDKSIWYVSNEGSPLRTNLYTIDLNGKNKRRLTVGEGTHRIVGCNSGDYFVDYFSNATTPTQITLMGPNGRIMRMLEDNTQLKSRVAEMQLPVKEFFEISLGSAGRFNAWMIKPAGFDPQKRYPVLITQYSGPGSQSVLDNWSVGWEEALAQKGYIIACVDPRGTGGRGEAFKKLTYGHLGEFETVDQIGFAKALSSMPFVDKSRIGIYGWSYGGFMALNAILQGNSVFKTAIAVAPLSSWRFYDSVYTERYNGDPRTNATGYDLPSPINYAKQLRGNLLIIHGTADDNVHYQNTMTMAAALVREGREFELFSYPDDNHSMYPFGRAYIYRKMVDYILAKL